jgi:hypothetical protein
MGYMKITSIAILLLALCSFAVAQGPTLNITPNPVTVYSGGSQVFTASFSDNSRILNCVWQQSGAPQANFILSNGGNNAQSTFAATQNAYGIYLVTAQCANVNGLSVFGYSEVTVNHR